MVDIQYIVSLQPFLHCRFINGKYNSNPVSVEKESEPTDYAVRGLPFFQLPISNFTKILPAITNEKTADNIVQNRTLLEYIARPILFCEDNVRNFAALKKIRKILVIMEVFFLLCIYYQKLINFCVSIWMSLLCGMRYTYT